jgi:ribokinase
MKWDAIGIGLAVRDVSVLLDRYPRADEKVPAREFHESGGGPVPTALVTLSRLGRRSALSALVGDDAVGRFILEGLVRECVDTSSVATRSDFASQTSVILVENARRTIMEAPKSVGLPLEWSDVERLPLEECKALLVDARAVDVQLRAAEQVRRAGGLVVLDCGRPRAGVEELLRHSDIAILSHSYPLAVYGENYEVCEFVEEIRGQLPTDGPAIAGLTLGEEGCAVGSRSEPIRRFDGLSVRALDTTGAGDVFHGAFVHAYLKTSSVAESARFANVAAAKKCEGMTGRAPIPEEAVIWDLCRGAPEQTGRLSGRRRQPYL